MRFVSRFLLPWLLLWPAWPLVAEPVACDDLMQLAAEIHKLRDEDASEGVARGEALLERIYRDDLDCAKAEMLVLRALASNLHILGRPHEGLVHMRRALQLLDGLPDVPPENRAEVHLTAGVLHWELEAHDQAISHYLASMRASEAAGDTVAVARAAGNIGNLYNTTSNFQRARAYHERALAGFEQEQWQLGVAGTLVNLAALAGRMASHREASGDLEAAAEEYSRMLDDGRAALALFETLDNDRGIAHARTNIATALAGLGRPREALEYQQAALALQREVGDRGGEVQSLIGLARIEQSLGSLIKAAELLNMAIDLTPEDNLARRYDVIGFLADLEQARGDYRAALEYQKTLNRLRSRIADNQMAARVEEVRLAQEAEQRDQELVLLRREAEIADLRLERQRTASLIAALLAVLLLILLGFVFTLYRGRVQRSRQLEHVARTDPLTELSNRRDMMERLEVAYRESCGTGEVHSIILADIDEFKRINDRYGHAVGDEVLRHVAWLLNDAVRGRDAVARWGGEEFLVLLQRTDLAGGDAVAASLIQLVAAHPAPTAVGELSLTMTAGVAELTVAVPVDEAIRRADAAMYRGKASGRNRHVVARNDGIAGA
jgi:diguanylate cyclase (GGDEF)-like protein